MNTNLSKKTVATFSCIAMFFLATLVWGEIPVRTGPLNDPGIPFGEELRYRTKTKVGDRITQYSLTMVNFLQEENAYQFKTQDSSSELTLVVSREKLIPLRRTKTANGTGISYTRTVELNQLSKTADNEILVLSLEDISYFLRGYPFENPKTLSIRMFNENRNSSTEGVFSILVEYREIESITIDEKVYSAHKLELVYELPGILSLFSGQIPKSFFWIDTNKPNRLLRYEGITNFSFGRKQEVLVTELISSRIIDARNQINDD